MTLDIRTKLIVFVDNGLLDAEVISLQVSDSALPGAGLIFTRGTMELLGQVANTVTVGAQIDIKVISTGGTYLLPRTLFVLGSVSNGLRGTTTVELGCKLTLYRNTVEDKVLTADLTLANSNEFTESDTQIVTVPISVDAIVDFCCTKVGLINALAFGDNKFSVPYFDLSSGYVSVINDLCLSFGQVGYASGGYLLPALGQSVTAINDTLIDVSPLSIGDPVAAEYNVKYNFLTLQENEPDVDKLNWEKQESYGLLTTITIDNPVESTVGGTAIWDVPDSFQYTYTPYTLVETSYDAYDRVVTRTTTERSIVAEVAPGYIQHIAGKYVVSRSFAGTLTYTQRTPPEGSVPVDTIKTESFVYKVKAPPVFKGTAYPAGYEEIEREETEVKDPVLRLTGSTPVYSYAGQVSVEFTYGSDPTQHFVSRRDIRTFETSRGAQGQQLSKTLTEQYLCHAYTQEGQQILADALQKIGQRNPFDTAAASALFDNAQSIKSIGTSVEINSGREVALQQRPPQAERTNSAYSAERLNKEVTGGAGGRFGMKTYSLPYAPDDTFKKDLTTNTYSIDKPGNAERVAREFGLTQSKYDYGLRNGVNIQVGLKGYPPTPCNDVSVTLPGQLVGGYGIAQSASYTFDQDGGIISADVLGSGAVTSYTKQFFGSSISYLPPNPTITIQVPDRIIGTVATAGGSPQQTLNTAFPTRILGDGVQALDTLHFWLYTNVNNSAIWLDVGSNPTNVLSQFTVVPLYSSRVNFDLNTITSVSVQSLPYAMALQTALSLVTKTRVAVQKVVVITAPLTTVSVAANAPDVAIGAAVQVPNTSLALVALAPAVSVSRVVAVPLTSMALAAFAPTQAGADDTVMSVPLSTITLSALTPEGVGANLETFYNSWRLQALGTDAWVYPDWWAD